MFLGHAQHSWQLREVNGDTSPSPGQLVAVPLLPVNSSSVYSDGYRVLPILCYHQFTATDNTTHRLELSAAAFEQQITYLLDNNFLILSFADVRDIMKQRKPIPEKAVVITIDDGYRSVYDVAWPILRKYNVPATLFVYTDFIGGSKALSWAQMEVMAASGLIEIESHGQSHTSLSRLPADKSVQTYQARVREEITGANAAFRKHLDGPASFLSYPYGNSSIMAADIAAEEGIALAATVTRGENTVFSDPYLLHRTMIYDDHDIADFARIVRVFKKKNLR